MLVFRIIAIVMIFLGAGMEMKFAWNLADLLMGIMAIINIFSIFALGKYALGALEDYRKQRKESKDPVFVAETIGLDGEKLDFGNKNKTRLQKMRRVFLGWILYYRIIPNPVYYFFFDFAYFY